MILTRPSLICAKTKFSFSFFVFRELKRKLKKKTSNAYVWNSPFFFIPKKYI